MRLATTNSRADTVYIYSTELMMKWRLRLMRKAGRRIPWKILINELELVGTIRTRSCNYGGQALILRGYERLQND